LNKQVVCVDNKASSDAHIKASQAALAHLETQHTGTII